jgi:predicted ATP-binding protein involved in virulence
MPDIRSITLRNFKGAEEVTIDISKRINSPVVTLIGLNESGKTTILEGLSYFVTGDNAVSSLFEGVHSKTEIAALTHPASPACRACCAGFRPDPSPARAARGHPLPQGERVSALRAR